MTWTPLILFMWLRHMQLETMPEWKTVTAVVCLSSPVYMRVSANRTSIVRIHIPTRGNFYVIFYSRLDSDEWWGGGGAPIACHVRGTYVVENFDEIFMLKLKTLSPSTAGIKDLPIVIYFFAWPYLRLGAALQNTCVGSPHHPSNVLSCKRRTWFSARPMSAIDPHTIIELWGEAGQPSRLIENEIDSMRW